MTSLFRSRQDAEGLHAAVTGAATPEVEQRHADLLRTVSLLTEHPPVQPRADFTADLRERLMAAAATELVATPPPVRRVPAAPTPLRRRVGTLAASLAIVGGTAGMAVAAQGSLPGDPLYPIKRGGEQVVSALGIGEASPGEAALAHAATRLDEAAALQRRDADTALVVRSVEEFSSMADAGARELFAAYQADGDDDSVTAVREFAATQLPRLDSLDTDDPAVQSVTLEAADTLESLDRQARSLCAACGDSLALPASDSLAEAAGAPSIEALLARPADQARLDSQALGELDSAQIRELGALAEREAVQVPRLPSGREWPATTPTARGPVASTVTTTVGSVGEVVEGAGGAVGGSVEEGVRGTVKGTTQAVDDLVKGLGDGVGQVTERLPAATGPLEQPVRGVTDTVDQAVDGVSGVTGSLSDSSSLLGD